MLDVHLKMCEHILGDKKRAVISGSDQKRKYYRSKVQKLLRKEIVRHRAKKIQIRVKSFLQAAESHMFLKSRAERGSFSP